MASVMKGGFPYKSVQRAAFMRKQARMKQAQMRRAVQRKTARGLLLRGRYQLPSRMFVALS